MQLNDNENIMVEAYSQTNYKRNELRHLGYSIPKTTWIITVIKILTIIKTVSRISDFTITLINVSLIKVVTVDHVHV